MLNLQSVNQAKKLKQELRCGGSGGSGGNAVTMRVFNPPTVAESGGEQLQTNSKIIKSAKSANSGGASTPLNTGLSATSAKSASTVNQKQKFEVISNPLTLTAHQKIDAFMTPCVLLPDDKAFLLKLLPVNSDQRQVAIEGYKSAWLTGMQSETAEHKKQNKGRHRANTWLRTRGG